MIISEFRVVLLFEELVRVALLGIYIFIGGFRFYMYFYVYLYCVMCIYGRYGEFYCY